MKIKCIAIASSFAAIAVATQAQSVFNGNGASGFGNEIGNGNLTISDSPSGMTITLNPGSGGLQGNNDAVIYLDTQAGGFGDTSQFGDNADGGRTAVSGANLGNPSRTLAIFPSGFGADYALSIQNSFFGVFGLAPGGSGSLNYLFGTGQSGSPAGPFTLTLSPSQMTQIGLTANSGQTFSFVGSLISDSAYRANETFGPSVTTPDSPGDAPNAGFNGQQIFSGADSYTLVPEPGTIGLIATGLAGLISIRRRK